MCGIFGYIGTRENASDVVMTGLKRLDYRGYDSWGVGLYTNGKIVIEKHVGKIPDIRPLLPKSVRAIGHTRWATHGSVSDINAHPHAASDNSFVLAQNGIVENFVDLKKQLVSLGYSFISETDTEVIVRLIEEEHKKNPDFIGAVRSAFQKLVGRNTIIILTNDGTILACRNGSPLLFGTNSEENELFFSSDALSFAPYIEKLVVMDNQQMIVVDGLKIVLFDIPSGKELPLIYEKNSIENSVVDKEGFPHFMLKEISENPYVIDRLIQRDRKEFDEVAAVIKKAKHVYTIGSGTAGNSAGQIAYYLRTISYISAVSLIGAEAQDYEALFEKGDCIIAPSQSGETADVLEILEYAKKLGVTIVSFVNMPGSYMTRISDYACMAQAGPEVCVASTKIFVSQIAWGYLVAKAVIGELEDARVQLAHCRGIIHDYIKNTDNHEMLRTLAHRLAHKEHLFLLAKGQNRQIINEAMVKIIEESYVHAHAIAAGDLKHYAITIMAPGIPVIVVTSHDAVAHDVVNSMHQVAARGAEVILIGQSMSDEKMTIVVPDVGETSAIANIVPLQLLAYYMGVALGNDIDKPRNIAKSVTVK